MANYEFNASPRDSMGKRNARRLRADGMIPASLYGAHQEPESLVLDSNHVANNIKQEGVFSHILTLQVGSKTEKVVLKNVQRNPNGPGVLHLDFQRINVKEKLNMHVPLHFLNEETCPGVEAGGVISHVMKDIEIRCLPSDLPEFIEIDLANLALDEAIHLSQVKLPANVELLHETDEEHDPVVVNVHEPRVSQEDLEAEAKEAELAAEAAAEAGEGEAATEEAAPAEKAEEEKE